MRAKGPAWAAERPARARPRRPARRALRPGAGRVRAAGQAAPPASPAPAGRREGAPAG